MNMDLKIELFGKDSIIVRELPQILSNCNVKKLIMDLVEVFIDLSDSKSLENQINLICSKMACHGSIRAEENYKFRRWKIFFRRMELTPFSGCVIMEDLPMLNLN